MHKLLKVATIKAGHPFRGAITVYKDGNAQVVQIKNIIEGGEIQWNELITTKLIGRNSPNWLQQGDVIFSARGVKNIAGYIDNISHPTVCSQHYYVIQVSTQNILPEFLAWQLNQKPVQNYLTKFAQGSSQLSIPKTLLEHAPIYLPNLEQQKIIIQLNRKVVQEMKVLNGLIANRSQQLRAIAQKVLINQEKQ